MVEFMTTTISDLYLHMRTVPVNKKFTFDDCRTIVLLCEHLRFVPNKTV